MKFLNQQNNKNTGYAILFTVVIVSIISLISLGLSNTTYKQLVLSSLANDSQSSYFQSDTAAECAIYADSIANITLDTPSPWSCGVDSRGDNYSLAINISLDGLTYSLTNSLSGERTVPCFEFDVLKTVSPDTTTIKARGYNSCDKTNIRTVEREIKITY